jgi:hypothetical protein
VASDRTGRDLPEALDRLRLGRNRPATAWRVLAAGMVASAVLALWFGREVSWTIDEYSWISLSPDFGLRQAFEPYVGHLIAIPRLIYWATLDLNGVGDYWVFRGLALLSVFLMVGLLFAWLRRRVPDFVALPFCLVLLIFPVDHLHYLTGNGIVIALALAFGVAALLNWDRGDTRGDVWAFVFLLLGMMTYTVSIPFAIGLTLAALIGPGSRRRVWVGAVPLVLFAIWRLLEGSNELEGKAGEIEWGNLLLLPAWAFQATGSTLAAMTGLGFDFSKIAGGPADTQGLVLGPILATFALGGLAWRLTRGRLPVGFWVAAAILMALYASQVIVWGTLDARDPGAPRYLMPGALMLVLVFGEVLRRIEMSRIAFSTLWVIAVTGLFMSLGILVRNTDWLVTADDSAKAEVTAIEILETSRKTPLAPVDQPRSSVRYEYDPKKAGEYEYLGLNTAGIKGRPGWVGKKIDSFLVESLGIRLRPVKPGENLTGCRPAAPPGLPGSTRIKVPSPGASFRSDATVSLALGRYGAWPSIPLGSVGPRSPKRLWLPFDEGIPNDEVNRNWYIQRTGDAPGVLASLEICDFRQRS